MSGIRLTALYAAGDSTAKEGTSANAATATSSAEAIVNFLATAASTATATSESAFGNMYAALAESSATATGAAGADWDAFAALSHTASAVDTISATAGRTGVIDIDLVVPELDIVGLWGGAASINFDAFAMLPEAEITGLTGNVGSFTGNLVVPEMGDDVDGLTGHIGAVSATFPIASLVVTGRMDQITGTLSLVFPTPTLTITGVTPAAAYALYALNTKVLGVSEYEALGISSLCVCNGVLYGIGTDGLYEFTGRTNNGATIRTFVEKRGMDFGTPKEKRITDAYALLMSTGPYKVRITSSGKTATATCSKALGELHGSKLDLSRGIKGRMFDWAFFTEAENEFELVEQELVTDVSIIRRGRQSR